MILGIVLPPEIVDGLLTLAGAIIGWIVRKLQGRAALKQARDEAKAYRTFIEKDMRNRVSPPPGYMGTKISGTHINQVRRANKGGK